MKTLNIIAALEYDGEYQKGDFIGVDAGCHYLIEKNLPMKKAIGDFDSLNNTDLSKMEELGIEIIKLDPIKDVTDLEYTIELTYSNYELINVYGAIGKRIDHSLTNINLLKKYKKIILYDEYSKIYVLKKGKHCLKKTDYTYYSFYAIEQNTTLSLENFKYPLDNYLLKLDDTLCISNELNDEGYVLIDKDIIAIESK